MVHPAAADRHLRGLCDWLAAQRDADVPPRVRERARFVLADDLAAMVAALGEPEVEAYRRLVVDRSSGRESSIIAPGLPGSDRWQAASVNAVAGSWCELDEGYRPATCHAGLYIVPAVIAEAEALSLTLADVLRALALAYECVTRIATAFPSGTPTVHAHALWSSVGAAAGVAMLRGTDAATLHGTITAAATVASPGPRGHLVQGVLVRNAWAAAGAVAGMQCADWASCGIVGGETSLTDVFRGILGARENAPVLDADLGTRWSIELGYHKLYACCQHGHSAVEAVLGLLAGRSIDPERVAAIEAYTHPLALTLQSASPATSLGAKFSMPHMIAAPLVYGEAGAAAFSRRALTDPRVARLRGLVQLHPYEGDLAPPFDRPARIVLRMDDGERIVAECRSARGGPDRPLPESALIAKIRALAAPVLPGLATLLETGDANDQRAWRDVLAHAAQPATPTSVRHALDHAGRDRRA